MSRIPIIGGNWKMNLGSPSKSSKRLNMLKSLVNNVDKVDIIVAPPFTALNSAVEILKGSNIKLAAQNMYFIEKGAFTGEISPDFLIDIGVEYVILGHSERRNIFHENDDLVNQKLRKALELNLSPIVCIGEQLNQREQGKTKEVIKYQFDQTFKDLSSEDFLKTVIAYEPIWAIGTGITATPEQAEEIHLYIRNLILEKYDETIANQVRIQYGGSIKPDNAEALFKKSNIDGGLVGGASLDPDSFFSIIKAAELTLD